MQQLRWFVKENTHLSREWLDFGWGNGYVLIPDDHPLYGKDYENINVNVHYGLTFSKLVTNEVVKNFDGSIKGYELGMWCIGFDTVHFMDTLAKWPKEAVEQETINLFNQIKYYGNQSISANS